MKEQITATLNTRLIAFVYAFKIQQELNPEALKEVTENNASPGDFCDDNILMAASFADLGYIEDIYNCGDVFGSGAYNEAWNEAFDIAAKNHFLPSRLKIEVGNITENVPENVLVMLKQVH